MQLKGQEGCAGQSTIKERNGEREREIKVQQRTPLENSSSTDQSMCARNYLKRLKETVSRTHAEPGLLPVLTNRPENIIFHGYVVDMQMCHASVMRNN